MNPTGIPEIQFYTKPGCRLCDKALDVLRELEKELSFRIRLVDISSSEELARIYGQDIPVATLDGEEILRHRADREKLQRLLSRLR